ncbi:hypothetical protein PBAL39_15139 [Pedobacter sp. BAL39]|uniref:DUF3891 family protein n=1 Tax=Pedobacter sp. BAL39 TaxID=391596 RepID=UPI0001559AA9|nr:DUF3891 family protein [Pedobacter sp. BAL39]EDM37771.1 hypothetical protein PBAL39_15139 [Pedobacter sp. BAL39]
MIVNYTESGWQIITQRSHGLLAAQICGHWAKDNQPSRWVDTLIATAEQHIQFVHGTDHKSANFIDQLKGKREILVEICEHHQREVGRSYSLLEFCDAFSLLICQGLIQPEQRKIEISNGPDGIAYEMHSEGDRLIVSPWPFEVNSFTATYESRTLTALTYSNTADFRRAIESAKTVTHMVNIAKA